MIKIITLSFNNNKIIFTFHPTVESYPHSMTLIARADGEYLDPNINKGMVRNRNAIPCFDSHYVYVNAL